MNGIVDTGMVTLVLPKNVVERLGLEHQGAAFVTDADERRNERPVARPVAVRLRMSTPYETRDSSAVSSAGTEAQDNARERPMSTIGNIIWIVLGGIWMSLLWVIAGVIMFVTVIGIPWGRSCFVIAGFALFPFGHEAVSRKLVIGQDEPRHGNRGCGGKHRVAAAGRLVACVGPLGRGGNHLSDGAACETPGVCGLAQSSILLVNTHLPWIADWMPALEDRRHAERWK